MGSLVKDCLIASGLALAVAYTITHRDVLTVAPSNISSRDESSGLEERVETASESGEPAVYEIPKSTYSQEEALEVQRILYAEAANQSSENRKLIAECILNRVESELYPNDILGVIYQKNAFSCVNGEGSNLWKQAKGELEMNAYERKVFDECGEDAIAVLDGERSSKKIIAYHDISISKPNDSYWNSLREVERRLIFYEEDK